MQLAASILIAQGFADSHRLLRLAKLPLLSIGSLCFGLALRRTERVPRAVAEEQTRAIARASPALFLREGGGNLPQTWYPSARGKLVDELREGLRELR